MLALAGSSWLSKQARASLATLLIDHTHFLQQNQENHNLLRLPVSAARYPDSETERPGLTLRRHSTAMEPVTEASEVMKRHVEDSLAIIPPIQSHYLSRCDSTCDRLNLVDVGSGAGLPGLIFAIAFPGWKVTLLESMQKRCMFLEHAVGLIGLSNVEILCARAETVGQNHDSREMFDVAVARAVAEMRVLAEYCLPLVRVGGLFVAAKGYDPQEEVRSAKKAIQLMGASILEMSSVESHGPFGQRTAVVCLKDCPTPKKYPRNPGTPAKIPL